MKTKAIFTISIKLLIPFLFFSYSTYSQNSGLTMNKILYSQKPLISSPNASALEKYIEFPVATYTGIPEISIPIHQINLKGLTIPIELLYHASGIKVDEVSSDIGIGWSLNPGAGNPQAAEHRSQAAAGSARATRPERGSHRPAGG